MILKFQGVLFFSYCWIFLILCSLMLLRSEIVQSLLKLLLFLFSNILCGHFRDFSCFVMFCFALLTLFCFVKKLENGYENPKSLCTLWKGGSSQSSIQLFYRHHLPIYFGLFYAVFDTYHLTLFSSREHYDILPILKIAW